MVNRIHFFFVCTVLMFVLPGICLAGGYPPRNPKVIVPFAPDGAVIGQTFVAKSKPDGYTILAYTSSVANDSVTKKTVYTHTSFQPIVMYCFDPEVLVVPAASPYKTLGDLLGAAKKKELSVATPGFSTSHHVEALVLGKKAGVKFSFIHNESAAMQLQQILGGHVDAGFMSSGEASGYMKDGSLRVLGITQKNAHPEFPGVPTFRAAGVDMLWGTLRGLAVPKDTPKDIVAEYQGEHYVGSSTMPHKRNPEVIEFVVAMTKIVMSNVQLGLQSMLAEHERDTRCWRLDWHSIPESSMMLHKAISALVFVVSGLDINEQRITENLDMLHGMLFSEALMFRLGEKIGKQTAHHVIRDTILAVDGASGQTFCELVMANKEIAGHLSAEELNALMDYSQHIGQSERQVAHIAEVAEKMGMTDEEFMSC